MISGKRDPREDPRQGDVVERLGSRGMVQRRVVRRDGNQVFYVSLERGDVKSCWVTTWMDWARTCEVGEVDAKICKPVRERLRRNQ